MRLYPQLHALLLASAACGSSTGGGGAPMPVGVTIRDFSFSSAAVTVKVGTTVKWANNGPSVHTATSNTGTWDSGQLSGPTSGDPYYGGGSPGATYQYTFMAAGTYDYHCSNHPPSVYPGFTGTITVTP